MVLSELSPATLPRTAMISVRAADPCLDRLTHAIAGVRRKAAVYNRWAASGQLSMAMAYALMEEDIMDSGLALEAGELLMQPA